ncbi:serine palmitoyltransferase 1-like [Culicoides brevitarsis]|uniref:serine palmitoyltransferase 1-like n=1 Tax=Culicoides brevitarsis TaxID=469753 RepID=UPI00307BFEE3
MVTVAVPYIFNEIYSVFKNAPPYALFLEVFLLFAVIWLIFHKSNGKTKKLSPEEKARIIENWTPEPLVAFTPEDDPALKERLVTGRVGKRVTVNGVDCLNLASHNYLGLLENPEITESAIKSLRKYGVGSCGPRGFYGTVDVHLELEERLAQFMNMEEAVVYSYAFSTIASAIPAYSKRADIIFVDEAVNFSIQKGLDASRSKIVFFKHNDMKDLEAKLEEQAKLDKKNPRKAAKTRKFLVAEGIYFNTGEICPLRELVELRKKYKLRMFLDESISFGCLGKGKGLTEHLGIDKIEIDLISASLEHSISSIGGFCVGSSFIVEHQRLSGLGYCFSASLPPLLAQAAISALDTFEKDPQMFDQLQEKCSLVQEKFSKFTNLTLRGDILSPLKHLYLRKELSSYEEEREVLEKVSEECIKRGVAVVKAEYLDKIEKFCPRASIRIAINRLLTKDDITTAFDTIEEVSKKVLAQK